MKNFDAIFFDGKSSNKVDCQIQLQGDEIFIPLFDLRLRLDEVEVSSKIKNISQTITLKNGSYFMIDSSQTIKNNFVLNLENKIHYVVFAFLALIAFIVFSLTIGSSMSAKILAYSMPDDTLDRVSHEFFKKIEKKYLEPTKLDKKTQRYILENFKQISPKDLNLKLHFYSSPTFKANAFALPSGDIILLDDLVKMDEDQLLRGVNGVLAHEIGHVKNKHALQNIIRASISGTVIGYFVGDFSYLLATLTTSLATLQYSQDFENEADDVAVELLAKHKISIKPLIKIFEAFDKNSTENLPFFSTHPMFKERIEKFQKAYEKNELL